MSAVLKRITTRAKQIYKKGRAGISWVAAIKRASVQIKSKASPKRKRARTVRRRRRVGALAKGPRTSQNYIKVPNVAGIGRVTRRRSAKRKRQAKSVSARYRAEIKSKLAAALLSYDLADTIRATKAAQKRKIKYRKILKAL